MQPTIGFELVGPTLVGVNSTHDPSDADWDAFSAYTEQHLQQTERLFVYSAGGAPNVKQRRKLTAITQHRKIPGALVTASRMSRAVGVAITWFHREFRVFSPEEMPDALEFLGLSSGDAKAVIDCVHKFARQLNIRVPGIDAFGAALR